jgi:hypothetical protein
MRDAQDDFGLTDPHSKAETERQSPCGSGKSQTPTESPREDTVGTN